MVAYQRSVGTGRFTAGNADAIFVPQAGTGGTDFAAGIAAGAGKPPFVFMTGGGQTAANDPAVLKFDLQLDKIVADGQITIVQPSVPWSLGSDIAGKPSGPDYPYDYRPKIEDAVDYARTNLGATNDPPILFGYSNGWNCAIRYARDYDVTAVIGALAPTDFHSALEYAWEHGSTAVDLFEDAWNITYTGPAGPGQMPLRASPFLDVDAYTDGRLAGKVQVFYSASDYLFAPQQQSFFTQIRAEMHNIGPIGHTGNVSFGIILTDSPAEYIDSDRLLEFVQERIAAL